MSSTHSNTFDQIKYFIAYVVCSLLYMYFYIKCAQIILLYLFIS